VEAYKLVFLVELLLILYDPINCCWSERNVECAVVYETMSMALTKSTGLLLKHIYRVTIFHIKLKTNNMI